MKKYLVLLNLIICLVLMTACDGKLLRKSPYSVREMEEYLEETYQDDFVVLTRTECYDSQNGTLYQVEYHVQCGEDEYKVVDDHCSGVAGWNVHEMEKVE